MIGRIVESYRSKRSSVERSARDERSLQRGLSRRSSRSAFQSRGFPTTGVTEGEGRLSAEEWQGVAEKTMVRDRWQFTDYVSDVAIITSDDDIQPPIRGVGLWVDVATCWVSPICERRSRRRVVLIMEECSMCMLRSPVISSCELNVE